MVLTKEDKEREDEETDNNVARRKPHADKKSINNLYLFFGVSI